MAEKKELTQEERIAAQKAKIAKRRADNRARTEAAAKEAKKSKK